MMNKKNILIAVLAAVGIVCMVLFEGFVKPEFETKQKQYNDIKQNDALTHDFGSVLKYKNFYMGDSSNIINLTYNLPLKNVAKTFNLYPEKLMLEINNKDTVSDIGETKLKQALVYNSTAYFVLIDNLKIVKFNFVGVSYTIKRGQVEYWYGVNSLRTLQEVNKWKSDVQKKLYDEDYVDNFMKMFEIVKM